MADDPTLLSYQQMYEIRVFDLMTNSQQMNDYGIACMYAESLLEFVGSEIPQKPIAQAQKEIRAEPIMYYELLFKTVLKKIRFNIDTIRKHYGKQVEIPQIISQPKTGERHNGT